MGTLKEPCRTIFIVLIFILTACLSAIGQTLVATIPVGVIPVAAAVNSSTNKIYVVNQNSNSVTVIDGASNATVTVPVGSTPQGVDVNASTNKIYVTNEIGNTVTVIDGSNNATSTLGVGNHPVAVAVNATTNKIYVANYLDNSVTVIDAVTYATTRVMAGNYPGALAVDSNRNKIYVVNCGSNSVTVIDGATNFTSSVSVGGYPVGLAIDQTRNKVYVADYGTNDVAVIDGATLSVTTVVSGSAPSAVAVDLDTNQIYVTNKQSGTVTVIDGATLSTSTIAVNSAPTAVAVDSATNQIYVTSLLWNGLLTVIDGASGSLNTVTVGAYPAALAVNKATSKVYVLNSGDNTVSVIAEAAYEALQFVPVTPCRAVDTRWTTGPMGGPRLPANTSRSFAIPRSACNIPATAAAYALNVTVVPHGTLGFLTLWPTGQDRPSISVTNSWDGRIKANAAIVPAGSSGAVSVYTSNATDVVLDISGYFVPTPNPNALAFYPLKPCRVADTRWPRGSLGGPYLQGGSNPRSLPLLNATSCNIPSTAQAYSLNFTAIPRTRALWVFSTWPHGQAQPNVSTINAPTGTVTANAAIVPAGTNGAIDVAASDDTDLAIDINGYFAPSGSNGLSLYPTSPCRAVDTRETVGVFSGELIANIVGSSCGISASAQAFVLNATVVPSGPLWLLALWPDGQQQPSASTLNAWDGMATSNLAIVPATDGEIDASAAGSTVLILDISSYFAP
ncbi:MAG: hypothetical protein WA655_18870 [Candidatus Korobacteraceae bacterium]